MQILKLIVDFLSDLQTKDWITLLVSSSALVVSIASFLQKTRENRLALRKQLTDLLEKLTDLNVEAGKFRASKDSYPSNYLGLLNDQRRFLIRQASSIVNQIKDLVSPFEYLLIAGGFDEIDDPQSTTFFELAISSARNPVEQGIAIRGYDRYLFSHGQLDEARRRYKQAIVAFTGTSDRLCVYRTDTLERWPAHEREWHFPDEANVLLDRAIRECDTLSNPTRRKRDIERLQDLLKGYSSTIHSPKMSQNVSDSAPPNERVHPIAEKAGSG
jgi:hypothetical protein